MSGSRQAYTTTTCVSCSLPANRVSSQRQHPRRMVIAAIGEAAMRTLMLSIREPFFLVRQWPAHDNVASV